MNQKEFVDWVRSQMNIKGWNESELARQSGLSHQSVQKVLSGVNNPGYKFCYAVSKSFKIPVEVLLEKAGLDFPSLDSSVTAEDKELLTYFHKLPPEERRRAVVIVCALVAEVQRSELPKRKRSKTEREEI